MKFYTVKNQVRGDRVVVADDMILTTEHPTSAGSRMLEGYVSLIGSEALGRLTASGYLLGGKAQVGEFAIDLVGETSKDGAIYNDDKIVNAAACILLEDEATVALTLDVNGSVRRAAAQSGLCSIKPTYGAVSRFGTVPVACSGETVSLMARSAEDCRNALSVISGYDPKDGTSIPESMRAEKTAPVKRVAVISSFLRDVDAEVKSAITAAAAALTAAGVEVTTVDDSVIRASRPAWNILMCAELCNNVSRYDGVRYGHRAESFSGIDELYTNSRTEAFGDLLKSAVIYGSETLSEDNYMKVYDKALRVRRVIVEAFAALFEEYDAVLLPACSTMAYTEKMLSETPRLVFDENLYTAPASISGLPAAVAGGIQLMGPAFSENVLLDTASIIEKGGQKI
ncbi:MAG: hypothetical protein GX897_03535 [Clostridiales bacterium]|nr:hypothetical protein [Clostridiales bacterium]